MCELCPAEQHSDLRLERLLLRRVFCLLDSDETIKNSVRNKKQDDSIDFFYFLSSKDLEIKCCL